MADDEFPPDVHVRRGQDEYWHALSSLLPQGIAWPRWPTTTQQKIIHGLSGIMGFVDGRAADMLERESDPRQTVEMLDQWERAWGLPDPCVTRPQTIGERQQALVMKMTMLGAQSRAFFYDVAIRLGYQISITEYRPFMIGVDRCGDNRKYLAEGGLGPWPCQIGTPTMRFAWTIHLQQTKLVWFRVSKGQVGIDPHLRIERADDLECMIRRWRPAQTEALFDYSGISDPFAAADRFNVTQTDGQEISLRDGTLVTNERPATVFWPQAPNAFWLGSPTFATPLMLAALAPADPATTAWQTAVTLRGGTVSSARLQQVDLLIKRLKVEGIWQSLDRLWLWAAENETSALVDLVAAVSATKHGSLIFGTDVGYIATPPDSYINSGFNPSTAPAGKKFTRNSASFGVWSMGAAHLSPNIVVSNLSDTSNNYIDINDGFSDISYFAINDLQASNWAFSASTLPYGMFTVNRNGTTNSQAYYNGIQNQFSSNQSGPVVSSPITFCGGLGGYVGGSQLIMGYIGGGMTVAQQRAFYNHLRSYFMAIGVPIGTPPAPPL